MRLLTNVKCVSQYNLFIFQIESHLLSTLKTACSAPKADNLVDNVDNFRVFCMDNLQVFLADICKYFPQLHPIHKK